MLDQVVIATSNQSHHCTILLILKVKIALGSKKKFLMCHFLSENGEDLECWFVEHKLFHSYTCYHTLSAYSYFEA